MNGINYNTLLGNTGLFSQQTNTVADELKYKGTSTKEKTTDKKQTNADHDTVEINGEAGQLQANIRKLMRIESRKAYS